MSSYEYGSVLGGFVAGFFILIAFIVLIGLAVAVLQIIGHWNILKKGGKPGWGALIPFYNQYLLCDMVGVSPWWVLIVACSSVLAFIPIIGSLLTFAITIYFLILLNVSLARSFGKEDGYAIGLILLSPVFYLMLGCGSSEYVGKKPMNDFVMDNINKNNTNNSTNNENTKFCTSCGSKMDKKSKFCPSCGKEVK